MKTKIMISVLAGISIGLFACNNPAPKPAENAATETTVAADTTNGQNFNLDTTQLASGASYFQCEMHPAVLSDKMGLCPDCEMDLTEIKKQ